MAFLENLGKKIGETAQAAAKKSGELVEITKLNMNINSEEDKIQKLYTQIGKNVFEKFLAGTETSAEYKEACEGIKAHEETIKNLKAKIMEVKNLKTCSGCGAELDKSLMFCSKCGAKQEMPESAASQTGPTQACPSCGASVPAGSTFCTSCGNKIS
jgi:hypothetical protein